MELPRLNISPVVFDAKSHTYKLGDKYLRGITGTLIVRAFPNTYPIPEGMSEAQWNAILKKAAAKGTAVHQTIELYEDLGAFSDSPELKNYIQVKAQNGFTNIATEYIVSDEEHYASAIDHVWVNEKGEIYLVDIKHTYSIHEEEVRYQLSIYKNFFEKQNSHLRVSGIALLWLRGEKYEFRTLVSLPDEIIEDLISADLNDTKFDIQDHYGELQTRLEAAEEQITLLESDIKQKTLLYNKLKTGLQYLMEKYGVSKFAGDKIQLTLSKPTVKEGFDAKALKADYPEIFDRYKTESQVKSSLRITFKK